MREDKGVKSFVLTGAETTDRKAISVINRDTSHIGQNGRASNNDNG